MPTQIPVKPERPLMAAAIAALMQSLLAAAMIGAIAFIIVWAYS
jgi:hypothetical protein